MRISAARTLVLPLAPALIIAIALCSAPPGYAGTLRKVPGTYPTIQAAINAALSGDEVVVAPGRYCESIDFLGKNITVRSSSGNPADTIIDGGENLTTVSFVSGESSAAVLRGFTITHGLPVDFAWGIECEASSPTVVDNVIRDNPGSPSNGGGIYSADGSPTIDRNTIEGNGGDNCGRGAGVCCYGGSPRITGNTIRRNAARSNGGGIYCSSSDAHIADNVIESNTASGGAGVCFFGGSPEIIGNTIRSNAAQTNGGGIFSSGAEGATVSDNAIESNSASWGGGIFWANPEDVDSDSNSITANNITGNVASWVGGGIVCGMSDVAIRGNSIDGNSGMEGAGISCISGSASIVGNTIHHNTSLPGGDGGTVSLGGTDPCAPLVVNNTLSHNASATGAISCYGSAKAILRGNIIALDTAGYGVSVDDDAVPTITYCNVFANVGGKYSGTADATGSNGNISKDPLFANAANGDFHLKSRRGRWTGTAWVKDTVQSPCIDAGDPSASVGEEPSPNGGRINMGAYGGTLRASKSWQNAAPSAKADSYSTNEDTPLSVASPGVLGNDADVDGDPLTAIKVTSPSHGSLSLSANGSFTYTPTANYNGSDSFTYKANDGSEDSNVATVTITVNPVNDAPVAVADSCSTDEDTTLTVAAPGVLVNDTDEDDDPLTAVKVSDPAHGSVTLNSDGSFTYTPTPGYDGPASFTYKANDGAADSNVATVSIDVTPKPLSLRPDAHVCPGPGYVGDNIYNTTGEDQTASRVVTSSVRAVYYIRLQNDGEASDTLVLNGTPGTATWSVRYYDYSTSGKPEITTQVTSAGGWETPGPIGVGQCRYVEIHVTPTSGMGGNSFTLTGTLSSSTDPSKTDVVKAVTNCLWLYRPDGQVAPGPGYVGNNIYNTTGAGQTASRSVVSGARAIYYIMLQNDGEIADKMRLKCNPGDASWAVRYYDYTTSGKPEITAQITSVSGWTTPVAVAVAKYRIVEAHVTPTAGMGGQSFTLTGTVASDTDAGKTDVVKAVTQCVWWCRPDGLAAPGPGYVGNGIYNTTGAGQTVGRTVFSGARAIYYFMLQNDGEVAEKLNLKGTPGSSSWIVKYYDYHTSGRPEITAAVTSASGWTTPVAVPVGRYHIVEVHVTSAAGMGGQSFTVTGTVASVTDPSKTDVVKALTSCVWRYRPDGLVAPGPGYVGDSIYNTAGAGQTAARSVSPGGIAIYYVKLQNDGDVSEALKIQGTAGNASWGVRYYDWTTAGKPEITAAVVSASGWTTPIAVPVGSYRIVEVHVTAGFGIEGAFTVTGTIASSMSPTTTDVVKAVTTSLAAPASF